MAKVDTFPKLGRQIKAWLRSGVFDKGAYLPTSAGTPQGGVISPLLSNIALHGMETHLKIWVATQTIYNQNGVKLSPTSKRASLGVIRYADDFVVLHKDQHIVAEAKQEVERWLATVGLELKETKTRVTHTDTIYKEQIGFDFLGFNVRRYPVGLNSRNKFGANRKTIIKPCKKAIKSHYEELASIVKHTNKTEVLVTQLNPIIRGWCNYFSTVSSKKSYSRLRSLLFYRLWKWARKKHPTRPAEWRYQKYFRKSGSQLVFGLETTGAWVGIKYHNQYKITRHVKVKGTKSPYDGDLIYWTTRLSRYSGLTGRIARLLRRQKGKCKLCSLPFWHEDVMEIDHVKPKSKGGKDGINNLRLVHGHCHDQRNSIEKIQKVPPGKA
jgi:RNA-directed DNA polymerase